MKQFGEKLNIEVLNLLEDIRGHFLLAKKGITTISYSIFPQEIYVSNPRDQIRAIVVIEKRKMILDKLVDMGVVEIKLDNGAVDSYESTYLVTINPIKFDEVRADLKRKASTISSRENHRIPLYLSKDGNLRLEPNGEVCYSMDQTSDRLKILTYLVDKKDFQLTDAISLHAGGKDKRNIRSEIGKIVRMARFHLNLGEDDLIESKKGSGYRINQIYKVMKI